MDEKEKRENKYRCMSVNLNMIKSCFFFSKSVQKHISSAYFLKLHSMKHTKKSQSDFGGRMQTHLCEAVSRSILHVSGTISPWRAGSNRFLVTVSLPRLQV